MKLPPAYQAIHKSWICNGTVYFKLGQNMIETSKRHTWSSIENSEQRASSGGKYSTQGKKTNNWRVSLRLCFPPDPMFSRFLHLDDQL